MFASVIADVCVCVWGGGSFLGHHLVHMYNAFCLTDGRGVIYEGRQVVYSIPVTDFLDFSQPPCSSKQVNNWILISCQLIMHFAARIPWQYCVNEGVVLYQLMQMSMRISFATRCICLCWRSYMLYVACVDCLRWWCTFLIGIWRPLQNHQGDTPRNLIECWGYTGVVSAFWQEHIKLQKSRGARGPKYSKSTFCWWK